MKLSFGHSLNSINILNKHGLAPSLNLNSVQNLESYPLVNFTRSSTKTYFDENGVLQTALANTLPPSYEYNSVTGLWEKKGWLIEESRENLNAYSEDLEGTGQNDFRSTFGTSINENGVHLDEFILDNTQDIGGTFNTFTVVDATSYTISTFVKKGSIEKVRLRGNGYGDADSGAVFDINSESFSNVGANVDNTGFKNLGGGVYRIWITITSTSTSIDVSVYGNILTGSDGTDNIYIGGIQIEEGTFPTSYIPTSGATVTRSADVADITDLSWYNQSEGTFVVEFERQNDPNNRQELIYGNLGYQLRFNDDSNIPIFIFDGANVVNGNPIPENTLNKVGITYSTNLIEISTNGSLDDELSGSFNETISSISIGSQDGNVRFLNGYIKSLKYYPKSLLN